MRIMGTMIAQCSLLLLAVLLSSCAVIHRPPTTKQQLQRDADSLRAADAQQRDSIVERAARRIVRRRDATLDVLLLSGGGQNGAYGAGFLHAWKEHPTSPMPLFDIVTGVSTGALQAPLAFLGTMADLDTMTTLYRDATDRVTPSLDLWFWLMNTGGLLDVDRFVATIEHMVDVPCTRRLATAFDEDRQMFVATTDMDLGVGRVWSMADELRRAGGDQTRLHTLLQASSAIPGIFPSKLIDGHVHSDGGVISNVVNVLSVDMLRSIKRRALAMGEFRDLTIRLWCIMNVSMYPVFTVVDVSSRGDISARGSSLLFFAQQPQIVQYLSVFALAASAIPGLSASLHATSIPPVLMTDPAAQELFNKEFMHALEQSGMERMRGDSAWDSIPSVYVRP